MSTELIKPRNEVSIFTGASNFYEWMEMAKFISTAKMTPKTYQGEENIGNCLMALETAKRFGVSPFTIMQEMEPINGKPAFSSKFLIATLENSGVFEPLEYEHVNEGEKKVKYTEWSGPSGNRTKKDKTADLPANFKCRAFSRKKGSTKILYGPWVSLEMAIKEGWYFKKGSKWPSMHQIMLQYRAASFWMSFFSPASRLGMKTIEELRDYGNEPEQTINIPHEVLQDMNKAVSTELEKEEEVVVEIETEGKTDEVEEKEEPPIGDDETELI